jgi:hypothetical protein
MIYDILGGFPVAFEKLLKTFVLILAPVPLPLFQRMS